MSLRAPGGCTRTSHPTRRTRRTPVQFTDRTILVRSQHVVVLPHGANHIVYHSLLGNPTVVDEPVLALLHAFETPTSISTPPSTTALSQLLATGPHLH